MKFTLETLELKNAAWGGAAALAGTEIELRAEGAPTDAQRVEFRIFQDKTLLDVLEAKAGETAVKWTPLNLPGENDVTFEALLREKPTPANAHQTVVAKVEAAAIKLKGYTVEVSALDEAFVPKQESLELKYKVTDAGAAAKKGLIRIWGERYPKDEPLYEEKFTPAAGDTTWNSWKGQAGLGYLKDKYITPEFSPYRVQVIIGPDDDSVAEPWGKGLGKAAVAEKQFEIKVQSIVVRLQANPHGDVVTALEPDTRLVVEPRTPTGVYAAKARLPLAREKAINDGWAGGGQGSATGERDGVGRIRIKCMRHTQIGESLNQAISNAGDPADDGATVWLHRIPDPYMADNDAPLVGGGSTKYDIEKTLYVRPQIPLEIEAKLRSRTPSEEAKKDGLFEKEAVGPARFGIVSEDAWLAWMYENVAGSVSMYDAARAYLKKSAHLVKRGTHDSPHNDGSDPVMTHWQQRIVLTSNGQEEVGDTEHEFVKTEKELTVYLNGVPLRRDDDATADNAKPVMLDYAEISTKKIKLRKGLGRTDDVVWIVRTPHSGLAHPDVARWAAFPPGDNCHEHYGGIRGKAATDALLHTLRKEYDGTLAGKFPYTAEKGIDLDPFGVDAAKRELAVSQAVTKDGDQKGLAGIIFTPSTIAGDAYKVAAWLDESAYLRDVGALGARPEAKPVTGRTGTMVVWRLMTITQSWRLPSPKGSGGLAGGVGESDTAAAGRTHPGDGRSMNFVNLNAQAEKACSEWVILKADGNPAARTEEAHQNLDLGNYRTFFNNKAVANLAGFYNLADDTKITDRAVAWDHYREELPPGVPVDRTNLACWAIHNNVAKGGDPIAAAQEVFTQIAGWPHAGDAALGGAPAVGVSGASAAEYNGWVLGRLMEIANEYMDTLMAQINAPAVMRVLRWPQLYWPWVWANGDPGVAALNFGNCFMRPPVAGYCRGSAQAFFFSETGNPDTFEHEMGHSLYLVHFASGAKQNFGWKHHDHGYAHCLMGYNSGSFTVPLPVGKVGGDIAIATNPRAWMCPKCLLKVRGWDEVKL
ncbi:MAG: hypothetical protein FJ027_20400, partial [Candidatus Rokubacteria bacterium]|nr:hypothetical protein [Candidatus Rokubacteria bacterium]